MKVPEGGETIVMLGGAATLALAVAYGQAAKMAGNTFYLLVQLQEGETPFYLDELAACVDNLQIYTPQEDSQDALMWLQAQTDLSAIHRVITHGDAVVVKHWRQWIVHALKPMVSNDVIWTASVYGPMQCMMKGVCAQCLQWQVDPKTGERTKAVYSCSWQDQPMEAVDWDNLDDRLAQNHTQEILSSLWLNFVLEH